MLCSLVSCLILSHIAVGVLVPDFTTKSLEKQVELLSDQLEKFNKLYLTSFDQKLTSMVATISALDASFKTIQEKAYIWDIFRHHIDAWNDQIKSVDHKIDLIKRTQDDGQSIDSRLSSMEFTLNHILNKVDQMNDRNQEKILAVEKKLTELSRSLRNCEQMNAANKKDNMNGLNNILRHVINIGNESCRTTRSPAGLAQPIGMNSVTLLRDIEVKINALSENLSPQDLKQILEMEKQSTETIEEILDVVRNVDDKISRLINSNNDQSSKLDSCCSSNELTTFTESADLLLKRIEKLVLTIQGKLERVSYPFKNLSDSSLNSKTEEGDNSLAEFRNQNISGCHDLESPNAEGVYVFGKEVDLNNASRNFNERYCAFSTIGVGWTVIQQRGPFEQQENFNRSWTDYKNGFGNLTKDFWFGLEFMYRLTDTQTGYSLRVELEDFENKTAWAEYSYFRILPEEESYTLIVSDYTGNASDALSYHSYVRFSTYDKKNDNTKPPYCPCAPGYGSGWWYDSCSEANLNGIYRNTPRSHDFIGIVWEKWRGDYSLKKVRMLARPSTENSYLSEITEDP